jgi:hypothetical protein
MFDRKIYGDQQVWINNQMISGVQSIDGNYTLPVLNIPSYGGGFTQTFQDKFVGNVSIDKLIVGHDLFYDLITTGTFTGHLDYEGGTFGFLDAYITNYTCACAVGEVATSSIQAIAYGDVGTGVLTTTGNANTYPVQTVGDYGINLVFDNEQATNRVQSFSYSVDIERKPIYFLGSSVPDHYLIEWPVTINFSVTLDVDDFDTKRLTDLACAQRTGDLAVSLLDCPGDTVNTLYIPNAKLEDESVNGAIGNNLASTLVYRAYLNSLEGF